MRLHGLQAGDEDYQVEVTTEKLGRGNRAWEDSHGIHLDIDRQKTYKASLHGQDNKKQARPSCPAPPSSSST
jgi:hypothetical protein